MMKTLKVFGFLIFGFLISACGDKNDFVSIFNGKDLSGWVIKCTASDTGKEFWYVEDGLLVANSMGDSIHDYIWLQYKEAQTNFHFRLKFRPIRGNTGNTGVQIRSSYNEEEQWLNGPQIDIHPSGPWRTGMMWDETKAYQRWIFPDLPKSEWVNPDMAIANPPFYFEGEPIEWNVMEIIADAIHKELEVGMRGYICLQIHIKDQLEIRFKDIELKKLK
jgi:hypothetical protein